MDYVSEEGRTQINTACWGGMYAASKASQKNQDLSVLICVRVSCFLSVFICLSRGDRFNDITVYLFCAFRSSGALRGRGFYFGFNVPWLYHQLPGAGLFRTRKNSVPSGCNSMNSLLPEVQ